MCLCLCVHVTVHVCGHMHVWVSTQVCRCEGPRLMMGIPFSHSPLPLLTEAGVSTSDTEVVGVATLSSQLVLSTPCLCLLKLELQISSHSHLAFPVVLVSVLLFSLCMCEHCHYSAVFPAPQSKPLFSYLYNGGIMEQPPPQEH